MRTFLARAGLTALIALAAIAPAWASPAPAFVVIVHPDNGVSSLDRQFLEDAFLKRVTRWPSGGTVKPVDLAPSSPVRHRFSADVLHRSVEEVRSYWQQRIFSGRDVPPPELDTDEQVVQYVVGHPGALGYVSPNADLKGARAVAVH